MRSSLDSRIMAAKHLEKILDRRSNTLPVFTTYTPRAKTHITNESNLTGGENIGGTGIEATAPAADGDDDGGDNDSDPDRRSKTLKAATNRKALSAKPATPSALLDLRSEGYARLPQVLSVIPISKSSWWAGCKSGRYPAPVKLGPRTTVWKISEIRALIAAEA